MLQNETTHTGIPSHRNEPLAPIAHKAVAVAPISPAPQEALPERHSSPSKSRDSWYADKRTGGLWRFAIAISLFNIFGYILLGFEPAWIQPLIALVAAYATELGLETIDALACQRRPKFLGGTRTFVEFLLPAHITGLAVSMLLYAGQRFWIIAFASALAIASKTVFQLAVPRADLPVSQWPRRHFLNPSNFGIAVTLLLFPSLSITPPYHFTENATTFWHWAVPAIIFCSGTAINTLFTKRLALIAGWIGGFVLQAVIRHSLSGNLLIPSLAPMTGLAFVLFSFYMVTDPATTPSDPATQFLFGLAVAATYSIMVYTHVAYGLFFALGLVTAVRGAFAFRRVRIAARSTVSAMPELSVPTPYDRVAVLEVAANQ